MTNEEIEKKSDELARLLRPNPGALPGAAEEIAKLVRNVASQAYEEAINAACGHCAEGAEVSRDGNGNRDGHRAEGLRGVEWVACDALPIHALKAALETVPA